MFVNFWRPRIDFIRVWSLQIMTGQQMTSISSFILYEIGATQWHKHLQHSNIFILFFITVDSEKEGGAIDGSVVELEKEEGEETDDPVVDLEKEGGAIEDCVVVVDEGSSGEGPILEPYVGMEFDSEDDARKFYTEYARRVGFVVRVMQRRRSGVDGKTLARRLGCNKQGFSPNQKGSFGPEKKPRPSAREGCNATILVKMEKSGKWVVTRFEKDHNHPLVVASNGLTTEGDKDKKIEELTKELEHQEQLCAKYREKLMSFMKNVEDGTEELSAKIQVIVENVRKVESEIIQKHYLR